MSEAILQIPCELTGSSTKSVTKTTKLTFESQEAVPPEMIARITEKVGRTGWLAFLVGERPIDILDVVGLPEIKTEKGEKSKSTRLRAALFRLWEATGKVGDSETHYNIHAEKFIEHVKSKIEEASK
jgi:hypothetical protein